MQFDKRSPIYLQLKEYILDQIISGEYGLGQELPSRRELASQLKINPNTVQRAYKELEEEGVIVTEANVPSRVSQDSEKIQSLKQVALDQAVTDFYQTVERLNLSQDQVLEAIEAYQAKREEQDDARSEKHC